MSIARLHLYVCHKGLWERPQGFERLVMPLGKQGSLSIVPPGIPSPRTERPSVFPRIFVVGGSTVESKQLCEFHPLVFVYAIGRTRPWKVLLVCVSDRTRMAAACY